MGDNMGKILELKNVTKDYKIGKKAKFRALTDVDLTFEKGELVSILGESGSGKSTLMNLIGGLDSDFSGSIKIEGKDIHKYKEKELDKYRKNKIGFIFQSFNLIQHLSIIDNVAIAMTLSNVTKKERIKRAEEVLIELGLKDHLHKKPNQLSGGQKQRVAIARALMNDPEIIIADEPTGALDSETSNQILKIIEEIAKKGKLIIIVTHSEKVSSISTRVVRISDGRITKDERLKEKYKYISAEEGVSKAKQNLSIFSAMKISLNNMKEKLTRNILVSIGASIGIMSIIIMLSIGQGVENYIIEEMNEKVNPLVIEVNMPSENKEENPMVAMMGEPVYFEEENIEELESLENVKALEKGFSITVPTGKVVYEEKAISTQAIYTISSAIVDSEISHGERPNENGVVISSYIAKNISDDFDSLIGKEIEVTFQYGEKLISEKTTIAAIFEETGIGMNDNIGYIYATYQELEKMLQKYNIDISPSVIYLVSDTEDNASIIKEEVKSLGYSGSMQELMINIFMDMLDVITYVLAAIAGISLFVSSIMILVVLYISVVERTKEIGILKAIGARRKDIKRIFTTEAFLIGVAGGVIGVGFATLLSFVINQIVNNLFGSELVAYVPIYMVFGIAVSVIISIVSGLAPAAKAAKLDPIESLRHE